MQYDPTGEPDRFIDLSAMRPGSSHVNELDISNQCRSRTFTLYLRADIQSSTENDALAMELLNSITLEIRNDGNQLIYKGPASGRLEAAYRPEQIKSYNGVLFIPLGTYRAGMSDRLTVKSSLALEFGRPDMEEGDYYPGATAYVDWTFWVSGDDGTPPDPPPYTPPPYTPPPYTPPPYTPLIPPPTITIEEDETPLTIIEDELIPLSPAPQMGVLDTVEIGAIILMLATAAMLVIFLWLYRRKKEENTDRA